MLRMPLDTSPAAAVISALRLADEHGGARAALRAKGIEAPRPEHLDGLTDDLGDMVGDHCAADEDALGEALTLGMLAGTTQQRCVRIAGDATSFLMDPELVVRHADGESILRLPWFEKGLFVGRQLPDITEMPAPIRLQAVEHYSAALAGTRGQFVFHSYGHAYTVDAVPVRGADGAVEAALAVALPIASHVSAANAYERTATNSEHSAGRAERARENARRLHARTDPDGYVEAPTVTPRELEILERVPRPYLGRHRRAPRAQRRHGQDTPAERVPEARRQRQSRGSGDRATPRAHQLKGACADAGRGLRRRARSR